MVNFKKILHQTSPFRGHGHDGVEEGVIYRVVKRLVTAANRYTGQGAVYEDASINGISGMIFPFVAKRWGGGVTENHAEFVLATCEKLTFDEDDDTMNDEIEYNKVRYRIVSVRHHDLISFDDRWDYALKRKIGQTGGLHEV